MSKTSLDSLEHLGKDAPVQITLKQGGKTVHAQGWLERLPVAGESYVVNIVAGSSES